MSRRERAPLRLRLHDFRWLTVMSVIVIVFSVMAYGLGAALWLGMDEGEALSMLAVIPLMAGAMTVSSLVMLRSVQGKLQKLMDGFARIKDGDMDVRLDEKDAGEYAQIYRGFNRMAEEIGSTKREMQNFVNEFSHEFKTPITSINGFADYLLKTGEGIETPERMEQLAIIAEESLRLSELSHNVLLLSKIDACRIVPDKRDFSLTEQVKRCAILLLGEIDKKNIGIDVELPEIVYRGNPEWMEQVWLNLDLHGDGCFRTGILHPARSARAGGGRMARDVHGQVRPDGGGRYRHRDVRRGGRARAARRLWQEHGRGGQVYRSVQFDR